ncbi:hypothetical protein [Chryseobacterium indologenes]|uniref:hypothetical protein n=1 Tax=Chryseobacterium indologenes TaxID=253 RepID=UPI000F4FA7D6|nr:hypothetical protein [Chryseobacterium indologenes]MBF6645214.1 hypothetical protein [Chryseobacterium indologenes]MEB4759490.1 hypothetical protein [Chryseobacterium indologenes]QQQ71114.1 hypothetical protein JHW31_22050 [Chryseobacterium indologenes]
MYTIQKENKMHVILNIYLLLTLVMDIYILKINFDDALIDPSSKNIVSLIITLLDIFFTVMLYKWKRWALYGLGMTTIVIFIYNLSEGVNVFVSLLGLVGFLMICTLLLLKKAGKSGYENLK